MKLFMLAWTAAICTIYEATDSPWPRDLQTMWAWFKMGRWPCEHVLDSSVRFREHERLYTSGPDQIGYVKLFENKPNTFKIF